MKHCADIYGVFMLKTGRICIAGLNVGNVEHTADAIVAAMKACPSQDRDSRSCLEKSKSLLDVFVNYIKICLLLPPVLARKKSNHTADSIFIAYASILLSVISYMVLSFKYEEMSAVDSH